MKYASETNALALSLSNGQIRMIEHMVEHKDSGYEELMRLASSRG
jgi:hypothetical protein